MMTFENPEAYWYEVRASVKNPLFPDPVDHLIYEGPVAVNAQTAFATAIKDHEILTIELRRAPRSCERPQTGYDPQWLDSPATDARWQTLCRMDLSYRRSK